VPVLPLNAFPPLNDAGETMLLMMMLVLMLLVCAAPCL
jgi:hypothetical protein